MFFKTVSTAVKAKLQAKRLHQDYKTWNSELPSNTNTMSSFRIRKAVTPLSIPIRGMQTDKYTAAVY
jgi:hypothetical protein